MRPSLSRARLRSLPAFTAQSTTARTNIEYNVRRAYGHETDAKIRACVADTMRATASNRSRGFWAMAKMN